MQISVETLSDETITLEVEPSLSIRNVKILLNVRNKLVKGEWCPPNEHRLTFAGRELEDNHTLSYYGIQNDCLLHVVPRYRGGDQDETSSSSSYDYGDPWDYWGGFRQFAYTCTISRKEEIEKFIICCICTERYRQPKVLPCQHTFCLSCLELCLEHHVLSQSGKLKCPICRDEHSVPSGGVQAFPSNYTIIDLLNNPALVPQASDNEEIQNGGMQIFVKTLTGKTIALNVQPSDSVEMLKERIFDREGIRPAEQILICNGKPLQNGKTLSFFKIEGGSTVHLTARCVGGHY